MKIITEDLHSPKTEVFAADSRFVYFLNEEEIIGGTLQRFVCSHSLKEDDTYIIKRHRKIKHEIYI